MTVLLITIGIICFFSGICVGAFLAVFPESSTHLVEMDEPYQPME